MPEYTIEEFMSTEKTVSQNDLDTQPNLLRDMENEFYVHWISELAYRMHEEKGISILEGEVSLCQATTQDVGYGMRRLHIFLKYRIVTDFPIAESPFPLWAMKIIKWVIEAIVWIVIAWIAIQAIKDVILSFVLKTTTVHDTDPESPTYCRTETITEAQPFNVLIIVVGAVITVAVVVPILADLLRGRR